MKKILPLLLAPLLLTGCMRAVVERNATTPMPVNEHENREEGVTDDGSAMDLNESPRHMEWVDIKNAGKTIHTWVVYPQIDTPAPVVLLIHENKGLTDWVRSMADKVAAEGYIAVAPDLLSGFSDTHDRTSDFATEKDATDALYTLDPDTVLSDLQAVTEYAKTIPSSNQKIVSAGFCWGGSQSFTMATKNSDLAAALVFYGSAPTEQSAYSEDSVPVFGFYGGSDERINAGIPQTEEFMSSVNGQYEYKIYDGAGHAFMRLGEGADATPENKAARDAAWERMKEILEAVNQ